MIVLPLIVLVPEVLGVYPKFTIGPSVIALPVNDGGVSGVTDAAVPGMSRLVVLIAFVPEGIVPSNSLAIMVESRNLANRGKRK